MEPDILETRLARLEQNHLALTMEHSALLYAFKALMPLIDLRGINISTLLDVAHTSARNRVDALYLDADGAMAIFDAAWTPLVGVILKSAKHQNRADPQSAPTR